MAWNHDKSLDRIQQRWDRRSELDIEVSKLGREMDLENITLARSKRVRGVHAYATVSGSGQLDDLADQDAAARTVRALSTWVTEVSRIASVFEMPVIAAQGARMHVANYRPIDQDAVLARDAVLFGAALRRMTVGALNPLLEDDARLSCRTALDLGETVGTRGGGRGDSELLFLGSSANRAAKLLGSRKIVASDRLVEALDGGLDLTMDEIEAGRAWALSLSNDALDEALERYGFDWSVQKSQSRLEDEWDKWSADRCKVSGANETVYFGGLGRANSKLVEVAVIVADIDGFSAYIDSLEDDEEKRDAIVALDMIRFELREVLKRDYSGGVRVQYQGDNIVGLVHLPGKSTAAVAERALDIAAGMQASMQETLPAVVAEASKLSVTVGVALADTLATQLGPHGRRNAMAVGPAVTKADRISSALTGTEVGFSSQAYEALPEDLRAGLFEWSGSAAAWVASDLPASRLELIKESLALRASDQRRRIEPTGRPGRSRVTPAAGLVVPGTRNVEPFRPHAR
jgi:hypothetical protein